MGAAMLMAACGGNGPGSLLGDRASGLQYVLTLPWHIQSGKDPRPQNRYQTSSTPLACDIDTCRRPAMLLVQSATVGDLLTDPRYGANGTLDSQRAFERIFERTLGYSMTEGFQRLQIGNLYGFRAVSTLQSERMGPRRVASDFFFRGEHMMMVSAGMKLNSRATDEAEVISLLDQARANLRVDGKPVEN